LEVIEKRIFERKINKRGSNTKNKDFRESCRDINEFKKGYERRTNLQKVKRDDLFVDPREIVNRWKKFLSVVERTLGGGGVAFGSTRPKYFCKSPVPLRLRLLMGSWKV
jgi:hypothetical protein